MPGEPNEPARAPSASATTAVTKTARFNRHRRYCCARWLSVNVLRSRVAPRRPCDDPCVSDSSVEIRPARDDDRVPLAVLFAAVAEERDGIASEPPVDVDARAASWTIEETLVAVAGDEVVGSIHIGRSRHGFGDDRHGGRARVAWARRRLGAARRSIEWAREQGLHKLSLGVFAHNAAAIGLYRKFGFVVEGRRVKQYRRESGELWDAIDMGLLL